MNLIFSLVVAVLFGTGIYLMLHRDLIRMVLGTNLIATAVILYIVANSLYFGRAPIYPLPDHLTLSDPVVQALALTAIVINYGATALALTLVYRVYTTNHTLDQDQLQQIEQDEEQQRQEKIWHDAEQKEEGEKEEKAEKAQREEMGDA